MMMMILMMMVTVLEIDLVYCGDGVYDDMKCVSEDIYVNVVVLFVFEMVMEGDEVSVKVFDAKGKVAWEKNDVMSGRYGFMSEMEGEY